MLKRIAMDELEHITEKRYNYLIGKHTALAASLHIRVLVRRIDGGGYTVEFESKTGEIYGQLAEAQEARKAIIMAELEKAEVK